MPWHVYLVNMSEDAFSLSKSWITLAETGSWQLLFQQVVKKLAGGKGIPNLELERKYRIWRDLTCSKKWISVQIFGLCRVGNLMEMRCISNLWMGLLLCVLCKFELSLPDWIFCWWECDAWTINRPSRPRQFGPIALLILLLGRDQVLLRVGSSQSIVYAEVTLM